MPVVPFKLTTGTFADPSPLGSLTSWMEQVSGVSEVRPLAMVITYLSSLKTHVPGPWGERISARRVLRQRVLPRQRPETGMDQNTNLDPTFFSGPPEKGFPGLFFFYQRSRVLTGGCPQYSVFHRPQTRG